MSSISMRLTPALGLKELGESLQRLDDRLGVTGGFVNMMHPNRPSIEVIHLSWIVVACALITFTREEGKEGAEIRGSVSRFILEVAH